MCGIAGYLGKTKLNRDIIFNNLELMRSREDQITNHLVNMKLDINL